MNLSSPRSRSRTYAFIAALALTAIAAMLVLIFTRVTRRVDVTATRQHELSARTQQLLARLDRPATLAIAADLTAADQAARQGLTDVLDKLTRADAQSPQPKLTARLMNTGTQAGLAEFDALMADMANREAPAISARVSELGTLGTTAAEVGALTQTFAASLDAAREDVLVAFNKAGQSQWDALVAALRAASQDLAKASDTAKQRLAAPAGPLPVPPIDEARAVLSAPAAGLSSAVTQAANIVDQLIKAEGTPAALREKLQATAPSVATLRDRSARLATDLSVMPMPRVLMIARAIERTRAAMLISEPRTAGAPLDVVGIEPSALLDAASGAGDNRARAEDVIAGAIANLSSSIRPRVVFVHDFAGKLAMRDWQPFTQVVRRLSARGIDAAEWAVTVDRDLPADLVTPDPMRPAIFIAIPGLARATARTAQQQAAALPPYIAALKNLVNAGRPVLLCFEPSTVPLVGSPDPIAECLDPLGIKLDSGRVLLEESKVGTRRVVSPYLDLVSPLPDGISSASPVAGTLAGARLRASFPVVFDRTKLASGVSVEPLIVAPASASRWQESEWTEYSSAIARLRGEFTGIANAPAFDNKADTQLSATSSPPSGYEIALAVTRSVDRAEQRLVLVGFNGWFLDAITTQQAEVDGRIATLYAGNTQLLESAVLWLAGQEDQLVRTASASATPTIPPISESRLTLLRWVLAGGLPLATLGLGVFWRWWRG